MGEHHEVAVPGLGHRREDVGPAFVLDPVAGRNTRDGLGTGRGLGQSAGRLLREDRGAADHERDEPAEGRQMSEVLHGCSSLGWIDRAAVDRHFPVLKNFISGGAWFFLAGMMKPSALIM